MPTPSTDTDRPDGTDRPEHAPGVRLVPPDEAATLLESPQTTVLDIRTPPEVAQARLPGAVVIDIMGPDFAQRIDALDRDGHYLLYCRTGNRTSSARALMTQLGFADVADIDGGIIAWANAGLPLEQ
jgi:phage shock protein E